MYALLARLLPVARSVIGFLETWGAPLADLAIRVALFQVFFFAGLAKVNDWTGTLHLFQFEYAVPLLPYGLAALMAASDELICSVLLLVGLGSRLAALPLLVQAAVIQFFLGAANPAYDSLEHYLWMAMLLAVMARGPGLLSIDHQIRRRLLDREPV